MMRYQDVPMVVKMAIAPAAALAALALASGISLWTQRAQSEAIQRIAHKDMAVSLQLAEISKGIAGVHGEIYVLLTQQAAQADPGAAQRGLDRIGKETDALKGDLAKVETLLPPQKRKAFAAVNNDLNDYRGAIDVVGSMLGIDFKTAQAFVAPFEAHYERMTKALDGAASEIQHSAEVEAEASASAAARAGTISIVGSVFTMLAVSAIALATVLGMRRAIESIAGATRSLADGQNRLDLASLARKDELGSIVQSLEVFRDNQVRLETLRRDQAAGEARESETRRDSERLRAETAAAQEIMVRAVAAGLSRLSRGDLTCRLHEPFAAEYEQIRSDFNAAIDQLQRTLQVISQTAGAIGAGVEEIAGASNDLSRRTEQQAASLEQTASALDEITDAVKKAASSAHRASEVAADANNDATASGAVVKQAVVAMGKIEQSSRAISQIIGVIDEIAFQTNLLALNAGVEAARAGDSGRGFAVVAQEVRALAQRSAEAAREIKGLISSSAGEVGAGVALVGQTGSALERIIDKVAAISGLIGEIAANANGQAAGVAEVNGAVNQMDQMTQQNAAMVEQSTAATHNLKGETAELVRLISEFKVGAQGPDTPLRSRPAPASPHSRAVSSPVRRMMGKLQSAIGADAKTDANWEEF